MLTLTVNGRVHSLDVDPEKPLLWVLRDDIGLTAAKFSCGSGQCWACTVQVDGAPVPSCSLPIGAAVGRAITTPEGLQGRVADALREAWVAESVPQCGYCQPAQITHAVTLLSKDPAPTEAQIIAAFAPVLCRCGSYAAIRRAVRRAAEELAR